MRAQLGLALWQLGGVGLLARSSGPQSPSGGLSRGGQTSEPSQPGLIWDWPRSCWKDGQSWEVPCLGGVGSTDIWGHRHLGPGLGKRRGQDCSVSGGACPCPTLLPSPLPRPWLLPALPPASLPTIGGSSWGPCFSQTSPPVPLSQAQMVRRICEAMSGGEPGTAVIGAVVGTGLREGAREGPVWGVEDDEGCASEHDPHPLPMSCRSGRCDRVSTPEAWGALALTPPQSSPRAKEQRRQRLDPKSLERQMLFFPPGHSHQHLVTSDHHSRPFLLGCDSSLGTWILCQALPVFILPLTHRSDSGSTPRFQHMDQAEEWAPL